MTPRHPLPDAARTGLRRPLVLTRAGMVAERISRTFWPLWTICLATLAALMMGLQDVLPLEVSWVLSLGVIVTAAWAIWHGIRRFRWPSEAEALARLDATLPGRPIAALSDQMAIGGNDPASRALWEAHVTRMAERIRAARPARPDLRMAARDPFALRYAALLAFAMALLFGSFWHVGSVTQIAPGGGQAAAGGPSWEGWIEPPAYTGLPSLYLADLPADSIDVPEGSRVTLRLYGEVGDLTVNETVSGTTDPEPASAPQHGFPVAQSGVIEVDGPGGRAWQVAMRPDAPPLVEVTGDPERATGGEFRQAFAARDDFGVVTGEARIMLDMERVDRRYGLAPAPDPRDPIVVDLPLPISGDRADFTGTLVETFSEHPWANLPVTITYEVEDERGQTGRSQPYEMDLAGQRYFDPLAQALVEQRRDLLWSRDNARRVADVLRAVSWQPAGLFPSETLYLRLRVLIRRLEAGLDVAPLTAEQQDEIAAELWAIAQEIEFGDLNDARERLERAQDRLSEAMENGADDAEIAELMQEMREAMNDYIEQLAREGQEQGDQQQAQGEMQEMTGDQLQEMMDEIQRLMEEDRMAEAQRLMEQLNRMLENMRVTQGQQRQQGEGQQAMEGLQDTLRDQQELSDDSFRDMQEGQQPGQQGQQGQEGRPSQQGQGQQGSRGQGQQGQGQQPGQGQGTEQGQGGEQSLADRQQALRQELNRQRGDLPGAGTEEGEAAREALGRADSAMEGAEEALREGDTPGALDRQAEALEALREGMRNLGEAIAQEQQQGRGQSQGQAQGAPGGQSRDPLGRQAGESGQMGSDQQLTGQDEVRRRAEELLGEIRRRSGEQDRPERELDYLRRLLERF
ncbi:TIGR02302 family protein [Palleronia sp.]|uniref:TIGR02302 family protein n=1 Tax=Palleronia sp. TaxID=1940284 RepID=UPI0035C7EC5D